MNSAGKEKLANNINEVIANGVISTSNAGGTNAIIKSNEEKFLGLWKNSVGYYVPYYNEDGSINEDAKYNPDGKEVSYKDGVLPASIILSTDEWFFNLLETSERTQNHLQIMKYLMYKYSGKDYGVTELDLSIFDIKGFVNAGGGGALTGIQREAFVFLTGKGMTVEGAVSIMGNISQESGWSNTVVNSIGASGLCQWLDSGETKGEKRKTSLVNYAQSKGKDWTDVQTQLEFLWMEIDPSADKTYASQQISATDFEALMNATDINTATVLFRKKFERCGEAEANDARRISEAKKFYELAKTGGGTNGTTNVEGVECATYTSSSGKTFIEYKQDVGNWAGMSYGSRSIAAQGCSITSIAIASSGYGYNYTPAKWSGAICSIYGETKAILPGSTKTYTTGSSCGSPYQNVQAVHKTDIQNHLATGNAVIYHVYGSGRGYSSSYTSNQHWMVLTDINQEGTQVYVSNPNSRGLNGWGDIDNVLQALCCYIKVSN